MKGLGRHMHEDSRQKVLRAKVAHFCSMCGPKFCSMEITQQIRDFAAEQGLDAQAPEQVEQIVKLGLEKKSQEFVEGGAEIYKEV